MKDFFSKNIKKLQDYIVNLTPTAKIKYIVISVLTVIVTASLLLTVVLSTNKPEKNFEDHETGKSATIDFDSELIFEVGGESSSVGTTNDTTESSPDTSERTNGTVEITSGEADTEVSTDNNTETSEEDEPKPTDPSEDNNPDPLPVDTNEYQYDDPEPVDTTNSQTNPKPTETTKKPVETTKPTETTTKAPETTKPVETTTKAPETSKPIETTKPIETQPQENPPQQNGQFSVKDKKYDYNGANVSILQVENKSQQAYTITITGKFKDASGKVLKTESKTFEGFPGGWSNYFVFQPRIKYSSVTWEMEADVFTGDPAARYLTVGNSLDLYINSMLSDGKGNLVIPSSPEETAKYKNYVCLWAEIGNIRMPYKFNGQLDYRCDLVLFDNYGEIFTIGTPGRLGVTYENSPLSVEWPAWVSDILWENKDTCNILDSLNNASCVMSITAVELSEN